MNNNNFDRKAHWEKVYLTRQLNEVSWFQPTPKTSLEFFNTFNVPLTAKIIDIGGGDSYLADHLLEQGYSDITVLDISAASIERVKARLGDKAHKIKWIVTDILDFKPVEKYDFWHDRATFHFLTTENEISSYLNLAQQHINADGILVIGTFSENGPKKCSGIEIKQYSEKSMVERLKNLFRKIRCITVDHKTPFDTIQNFVFCSFKKTETAQ